ncbi:MAG: hypothetical protein ACI9C1_003359 [Candidatus Aldehydirespiratoraceae bacterium]|jgi:hypothetical protein
MGHAGTTVTDDSLADDNLLRIEGWTGPWPDDDPDANFKADIAAHAHLKPLSTLGNLSNAIDVPVGSIVHYVLARWASEGSSGLLELGPRMAKRLREPFVAAEEADADAARLAAYETVRQMVEWLNVPLDDPEAYP